MSIISNLKHIRIPFFSSFKAYFDLGTTNTRIAIKKKGVVFREPTYLGYNAKTKDYLFFGEEAKTIQGKTPEFLSIIRPITSGILADFDAEVEYLRYGINTAIKPYLEQFSLLKPPIHAVATTPSIATEIERKAVEESLQKSGATQVTLVERALATAAGCGFNIFSHEPQLVIDMGGGLLEVSVISGGGIVNQKVLKTAGENMNKIIGNYAYLKHGIVLGENTCENLKIKLLSFTEQEDSVTVRGKSLETGLPKSVKLKTSDIREALISQFHHVIDATREIIESSPPEVADAIFTNGIALAGKIAGVPGIENYFHQELKIDTFVVEHYADATIYGMMKLDQDDETLYKIAAPTY
ncbi:rod shape-determining protein [Candidatus Woesebacteria bacterium]|nr:rod shape-determining protein [Candidatus Woesebacteria bacterium]